METPKGSAYLREFASKNQCELMFNLNVKLEKLGFLQEEVRAVRGLTDTVESLLNHTVNKIQKLIKTVKDETKVDVDEEIKVNVSLKNALTGKPIKGKRVLKSLIDSNLTNIEFKIFNQAYFVIINAPLVKDLKLPKVLFANYEVQPCKLYILFGDNTSNQFTWFKSQDKITWTQVGKSLRYTPSEEDIGFYLKLVCVPCNEVLTGPKAEAVSECQVAALGELPECPFERRHQFTTQKLSNNCFRLVSYNVLSDRYADNQQFPYCSPRALAIDYRKQLLAKELLGYNSDIICLQEVDNSVYNSYFKEFFKNKNFLSSYHRKGNKIPEGLACAFNKSRFKKIHDHQIIYSQEYNHKKKVFQYLKKFIDSNTLLKDDFMKQKTSLHITVLDLKISNKVNFIIVANTHLYYHPDAELIRILQISIATTYLHLLRKHFSRDGTPVSVILCGDFNSVPTSAVYEFLTRGKLNRDHKVFEKTVNNINLKHFFHFECACGTPIYTNYTNDFKGCLDYIFIEKGKMSVCNIVPFPKDEELLIYEGLPNDVYPSDHLALVVDLQMN